MWVNVNQIEGFCFQPVWLSYFLFFDKIPLKKQSQTSGPPLLTDSLRAILHEKLCAYDYFCFLFFIYRLSFIFLFFLSLFYSSIVDLQCHVNLCYIAKWFSFIDTHTHSHTHIYIFYALVLLFLNILVYIEV